MEFEGRKKKKTGEPMTVSRPFKIEPLKKKDAENLNG